MAIKHTGSVYNTALSVVDAAQSAIKFYVEENVKLRLAEGVRLFAVTFAAQ